MTCKVRIDASLFALDVASLGVLSGELELANMPHEDDYICFDYPIYKTESKPKFCSNMKVKITKTLHSPLHEDVNLTSVTTVLFLEDIFFEDSIQGFEVCKYLENGFGLSFDSHLEI